MRGRRPLSYEYAASLLGIGRYSTAPADRRGLVISGLVISGRRRARMRASCGQAVGRPAHSRCCGPGPGSPCSRASLALGGRGQRILVAAHPHHQRSGFLARSWFPSCLSSPRGADGSNLSVSDPSLPLSHLARIARTVVAVGRVTGPSTCVAGAVAARRSLETGGETRRPLRLLGQRGRLGAPLAWTPLPLPGRMLLHTARTRAGTS